MKCIKVGELEAMGIEMKLIGGQGIMTKRVAVGDTGVHLITRFRENC
ncbi:hypothetical protein GMJAKD_16620 [Candidatus Electrothrix aarhusensis]